MKNFIMKQKAYISIVLFAAMSISLNVPEQMQKQETNDTDIVVQRGNGIASGVDLLNGSMPVRYAFSADGRRLIAGAGQRSAFYDINQIKRVDITFSQSDWWEQLANNYSSSTDIPARMTYDGKDLTYNVGVRFRGNTSYSMNRTEKKSFGISVDFENDNQKIDGYKNLNFNCAFNDNSFLREVIYGAVNERYISQMSSNYIDLYINGVYWGIYVNLQQIDNNFIEEWFLSKRGSRWRAQASTERDMMRGGRLQGGMPGGGGFPGGMPDNIPDGFFPGGMPGGRGFPEGMPARGRQGGMPDGFPERMPDRGGFPGGMPNNIPDGFLPGGMQGGLPQGMPERGRPGGMPDGFFPDSIPEEFFAGGMQGRGFAGGGGGGGMGGMGAGQSSLNYLGDTGSSYEASYTLKKTYSDDPWQDLADVIKILNQTPASELEAKVREVIDLDRTLWFLACEIIFTDDDSYVNKGGMDYYIYWDEATGRLTPLEYDGNEVLLSRYTNWSPFYNENNANYPLLNKLLAVPSIRQRYLAHFRTILEESFNPTAMNKLIDQYAALIDSYIQNDTKKMMTYSQFTTEVSNLKNIVSARYNYLMSNPEVNVKGLTISDAQWSVNGVAWAQPSQNDRVLVTAKVSGNTNVESVYLFAGTGLAGNFSPIEMVNQGNGVFSCYIPAQNQGARVRFYIEANAADSAKTKTYEPARAEQDVYTYMVR